MIIMFNGNVIIKVNIALTFGGRELWLPEPENQLQMANGNYL